MQPILANRLYLPEAMVDAALLQQFRHNWQEKIYEQVFDEDGVQVLTASGKPKIKRRTITHTIEAQRELLMGGRADWIGLPRGDLSIIHRYAKDAVDLRAVVPLGIDLQLADHVTSDKRWPDQARCVDKWLQQSSGLILGQTGSGKTPVGIGAVCKLGLTTLIISKRGEGEGHWEDEFRAHTNIDRLEQEWGRRLIGPYRHKKRYPITIATVQTFLHKKGYQRLIDDQFRFGLVIADEVHELVAPEFIRVFSLWAPLSWLGLTATIKRPDRREFLAYRILGPVAAKLKADQMRPEVKFIETNFTVPSWIEAGAFPRHYKWGKLLALISKDEDRIELIVNHVMQDINDGRLVAVVGERTQLLRTIHEKLRQNGYDVAYADGTVPKAKRKKIYADMSKGLKYRCLCAGKVLDAMVSIKPLDCLHLVTPVSARHRILQIFGRTRRPQEGKLIPQVRYYADNGGQLSGAYRNVVKVVNEEGWKIETETALINQPALTKWKPE